MLASNWNYFILRMHTKWSNYVFNNTWWSVCDNLQVNFLVTTRPINLTPVVPMTFLWSGRYPVVFLGCGRIQCFFPPAIGPAPSRKRSQTSPLYIQVVCQKCFWWRWRACPCLKAVIGRCHRHSDLSLDIIGHNESQYPMSVCDWSRASPRRSKLVCGQGSAHLGGRIVAVTATLGLSWQTVKKQPTKRWVRWK